MKYFIFALMLGLLSFTIMNHQLETQLQRMGYQQVDYALKHAVHDAALFVEEEELANGKIIFKSKIGKQVFVETLMENLPLSDHLEPIHLPSIVGPITILEEIYIDESYVDAETGTSVQFPFIFKYRNQILDLEFARPIFGPSVVYVIETKVHKEENSHQFITIQEYKERN
jgi:hypothetical protein